MGKITALNKMPAKTNFLLCFGRVSSLQNSNMEGHKKKIHNEILKPRESLDFRFNFKAKVPLIATYLSSGAPLGNHLVI